MVNNTRSVASRMVHSATSLLLLRQSKENPKEGLIAANKGEFCNQTVSAVRTATTLLSNQRINRKRFLRNWQQ